MFDAREGGGGFVAELLSGIRDQEKGERRKKRVKGHELEIGPANGPSCRLCRRGKGRL